MGRKLNIDEKYVVDEYLKGKSSLMLEKEMGVSKPTILNILNKHNIVRKRDRCDSLNIEKRGDYFYINRICPICNKTIETKSKERTIACRNYFNKIKENRSCKKCSLDLQIGEGNPFYGKTHSKKTKKQISKSRKGKGSGENNAMANPEVRKKAEEKRLLSIKENPTKFSSRSKNEIKIYNNIKKKYKNATHSLVITPYICDIFIPELNLIIEYNGDYWHCNPLKYKPKYHHKIKKMLAEDIWNYDKKKIDLIKNSGYNLEIVWETDFNKDPKLIYKIIKKYVKKN